MRPNPKSQSCGCMYQWYSLYRHTLIRTLGAALQRKFFAGRLKRLLNAHSACRLHTLALLCVCVHNSCESNIQIFLLLVVSHSIAAAVLLMPAAASLCKYTTKYAYYMYRAIEDFLHALTHTHAKIIAVVSSCAMYMSCEHGTTIPDGCVCVRVYARARGEFYLLLSMCS